jgi:hypothetical protein
LYLLFLEAFDEFFWVDADGESADGNDLALEFDAVRGCGETSVKL